MPISNMQQARQMYNQGGYADMGLNAPRQNYGLGSFVKKAVRGVKKIVKSPLGKAALIAGGGYALGGGFGTEGFKFGTLGSRLGLGSMNAGKFAFDGPLAGLVSKGGKFDLGRTALTGLGATALAAPFLMGGGDDDDEDSVVEQIDPRYQVQRAKNFYSGQGDAGVGLNFMPQKKYVQGNFYQPAADGGRIGYSLGSLVRGSGMAQPVSASMSAGDAPVMSSSGMGGMLSTLINNNPQLFKNVSGQNNRFDTGGNSANVTRQSSGFIDENMNGIDDREEAANGGRIGYAMGGEIIDEEEEFMRSGAGQSRRMPTAFLAMGGGAGEAQAEQMLQAEFIKYKNKGGDLSFQEFVQAVMQQQQQAQGMQQPTMMAANGGRMNYAEGGGIMDTEEASEMIDMGGQEKDYRDEGGFVAMGGEERADDVPARLSKNEFVFTADAVRNAGGGDIDRGSEVMQNMMDNLEQGGRISEGSQGLGGGEEMMSEEMIEEPDGAQAMYEQQQALQSRMI
jgi:hypothetical protein